MATKPAQRAAADRWDEKNMSYQTVKVKRALLDDFKAACVARGDKVNTVLREAMERYVAGEIDNGLTREQIIDVWTVLRCIETTKGNLADQQIIRARNIMQNAIDRMK